MKECLDCRTDLADTWPYDRCVACDEARKGRVAGLAMRRCVMCKRLGAGEYGMCSECADQHRASPKLVEFTPEHDLDRENAVEQLEGVLHLVKGSHKFVNFALVLVTEDERGGREVHFRHSRDEWERLHGAVGRLQHWLHHHHDDHVQDIERGGDEPDGA